ncbi:MAG TPA: amidohydrolase family protein, partial [bacterium]|nr:amidohydrolase family protein [bacterium]
PGMSTLLVRNAARILIGGPDWEESAGDVLIEDSRIVQAGGDLSAGAPGAKIVDARGLTILPGLVQTHVHLCQTLFRGLAEGLPLLPWLQTKIWPLEAAHDAESITASARLSVAELLLGGTTTILDMGTTRHHDAIFHVLEETGIRAASGKAMMDDGDGVPLELLETTVDALRESFDLAERWDGAAEGRLRYAFAPRFVLSCTEDLIREVARLTRGEFLLHSHAAESAEETALVERVKGRRNLRVLSDLGFLGPKTLIAHCIWLEEEEIDLLAKSRTRVLHCPRTNLKLGSGVAQVHRLRDRGVHVSIGCDGAPANNTLDAFAEMREAALLSAAQAGPDKLSAKEILTMATWNGAEALGWEERIGRITPGREADLIAVDLDTPHAAPANDAATALVYSAKSPDVRHVVVAGKVLVEDGTLTRMSSTDVVREARIQAQRVEARAAQRSAR